MPRIAKFFSVIPALLALSGAHAIEMVESVPIMDPGILYPPEPSRKIEAPPNARIGFSGLHTNGRNWLQVQIDSIGACQNLVVDSFRVLDTSLPGEGKIEIYLGTAPRRDVRVWWSLIQEPQSNGCSRVNASRYMVELPAPHVRAGSDTLLARWIPGEVQALGPLGRIDRGQAEVVNQAGDDLMIPCRMYECSMVWCSSNDTASRAEFMNTLREQIAKGLPVVRIARGSADELVPISLWDTARVGNLGPLTKWNAGNLAWKEDLSIRTIDSWGAASPTQWRAATGRNFYHWRNGVVCCEGCDTLCQTDSRSLGISSGGAEVVVSNDSAYHCEWSAAYDPGMAKELENDWLVLPDSSEVRDGRLTSTLFPRACWGRLRAWKIVNDTIQANCAKIAVVDLDAGVGVAPRTARFDLRIATDPKGIRLATSPGDGRKLSVRLLDPSGRLLSSAESRGGEMFLPTQAHGALVLEVRAGRDVERQIIAR